MFWLPSTGDSVIEVPDLVVRYARRLVAGWRASACGFVVERQCRQEQGEAEQIDEHDGAQGEQHPSLRQGWKSYRV
jgi:hypothetical protein